MTEVLRTLDFIPGQVIERDHCGFFSMGVDRQTYSMAKLCKKVGSGIGYQNYSPFGNGNPIFVIVQDHESMIDSHLGAIIDIKKWRELYPDQFSAAAIRGLLPENALWSDWNGPPPADPDLYCDPRSLF